MLFVARGFGALIGPFVLFALVSRSSLRTTMIAPCLMIYSLGYAALSKSSSLELGLIPVVIGHMGGGAMWQATTFAMQKVEMCIRDRTRAARANHRRPIYR